MSIEDDKEIVHNLLVIFYNLMENKSNEDSNSKEIKINLSHILMTLYFKYHNEIRIIEVLLNIISSNYKDVNLINELVDNGRFTFKYTLLILLIFNSYKLI